MRKIMMMVMMLVLTLGVANAQDTKINACGIKKSKVCRPSGVKGKPICYPTKYAENFAVCKGNNGYFICCETPNYYNTTFDNFAFQPEGNNQRFEYDQDKIYTTPSEKYIDKTIPQNQSYINTTYRVK